MSDYYKKLIAEPARLRFLRWNNEAAEIEAREGWGRGTVHFSLDELEKNDDERMPVLLNARAQNWRRTLELRNAPQAQA